MDWMQSIQTIEFMSILSILSILLLVLVSRKGTGMFRPCCLFSLLATDSHLRLQAAGV